MRDYAKYKVVWNRKNEKKKEALIQIEVLLPSGKQKWVGTGVYISGDRWDETNRQIINDSFAGHLNKQISEKIDKIRAHELSLLDGGRHLTAEEVDRALERKVTGSFVAYMRTEIESRKDIVKGTKSLHHRVANRLEKLRIIRFVDLTYNNIVTLDKNLREEIPAQTTRAKQHQVVKTYIKMAGQAGLFPFGDNPYLKFGFPRGKSKIRSRLDSVEIKALIKAPPGITRDMAVFQAHTGLPHKDLINLTRKDNLRYDEDGVWIEGLRKKNGEFYSVYLLPEAVKILNRYKGEKMLLPCTPLWKYNDDLKVLAASVGIDKALSSYVLRHTYATWMLRMGVNITTIRDTMGHSNIETTQIYARLEKKTIKDEMKKAFPVERKTRKKKGN